MSIFCCQKLRIWGCPFYILSLDFNFAKQKGCFWRVVVVEPSIQVILCPENVITLHSSTQEDVRSTYTWLQVDEGLEGL